MPKLRIKVSGSMHTLTGAHDFAAIRTYTATATRHGINPYGALIAAMRGTPGHQPSPDQHHQTPADQPCPEPEHLSSYGRSSRRLIAPPLRTLVAALAVGASARRFFRRARSALVRGRARPRRCRKAHLGPEESVSLGTQARRSQPGQEGNVNSRPPKTRSLFTNDGAWS
jgi:hypothetical protein